jgi:hypothetical protein
MSERSDVFEATGRRRRPPFPWFGKPQLWITGSLIVAIVGTMLPWFQTFVGSRPGIDGWGILTAWGAAVGLTGAFSVRKSLYRVMPLIGAGIGLGVVLWMAVDGARVCAPVGGSAPCSIGFGLIVSGAACLNALLWGFRAARSDL